MADIYEQAAKSIIDAAERSHIASLDKINPWDESKRIQFLKEFGPDVLGKVEDDQLLKTMFIGGGSKESLCNWLMYKTKEVFGDFAGYPIQFGLYCKKGLGWTVDDMSPLSPKEALDAGKEIRRKLLNCCEAVKKRIESNKLNSVEDYISLQNEMDSLNGDNKFAAQSWVRKYLYLWKPAYFVFWYTPDKILSFLSMLKITRAPNIYGQVGQILTIEKYIAELKGFKREDSGGIIGPFCWTVWTKNLLSDSMARMEDDMNEGATGTPSANPHISGGKVYETGIEPEFKRNRILFGAPGTGKSYFLNQDKNDLLGIVDVDDEKPDTRVERVTFHPEYSYANFVGTYKPVSYKDAVGNDSIKYIYVPGPFMRTYIKAWNNILSGGAVQPFLLIIEEINRANAAAVFGDIFQLLDRKGNGYSEYSIQASEDIRRYLKDTEGWDEEYCTDLRMPDNMFIWATMNSADQGVFPMDTAFKRRWNFEYIGIDGDGNAVPDYWVTLGMGDDARTVEWQSLRMAINDWLADNGINEDKQIGPYFITNLPEGVSDAVKTDKFNDLFTNKIIMYLFEDAAKQRRNDLFSDSCSNKNRYSRICNDFRKIGVQIFNEDIQDKTKKR